jgi:hypothetical protein
MIPTDTKKLFAAVALFILKHHSKYRQTSTTDCIIGIARRINKLQFRINIFAESMSRYEGIDQPLGLTAAQVERLYNFQKWNPKNAVAINFSDKPNKQRRTQAWAGVRQILEVMTEDGAKDYTTALLAACLKMMLNPSRYSQGSFSDCVIGQAAQWAGGPVGGTSRDYAQFFGVSEEEIQKVFYTFATRAPCWPASYWKRFKKISENTNSRPRDMRRRQAMLAVERTLSYIVTGE